MKEIDLTQRFAEACAQHQAGDLAGAIDKYRRLVDDSPRDARALFALGIALYQQGQLIESVERLDESLRAAPANALAHFYAGNALGRLGRYAEALSRQERAIELDPGQAAFHNSRGIALRALGRPAEALASYRRALALNPSSSEAHNNIGVVFRELGHHEEELASYEQAIALNPGYALAHSNRGIALARAGRLPEALDSYTRAAQLMPEDAEIRNSACAALSQLGRFDEAMTQVERALALDPDSPEALYNKALLCLRHGDYREGWSLYEWRWRTRLFAGVAKSRTLPIWLGREPIAGRRILIWSEQGLGDALQFCRYVPLVAALGAEVVFAVKPPLVGLMGSLSANVTVTDDATRDAEADLQCQLMSLPLAFETTLETIPARVPYLKCDAEKAAAWKRRLGESGALRVGLAWAGGFRAQQIESWSVNERRDIPLSSLRPLAMPGIEVFSLQKGDAAERQLRDLQRAGWTGPQIRDYTQEFADFSDTAAFVDNMDLIISVDTSVAHLAGALGKRVWILIRYDSCWRWLLGRSDSPWYPSATLFRQSTWCDWSNVVAELSDRLGRLVRER